MEESQSDFLADFLFERGQWSSLVAHWLSVPGNHGGNHDSNPGCRWRNFRLSFLSFDLMIAVYLNI